MDSLKQTYPNAEIDVVVEPRAKSAYRVSKSVSDTIVFDFKDRNSLADWANLLGILRDRYYDIAIALGQRWQVGLLLWLTGIPARVGYATSAGKVFLTHPAPLKPDQYAAHMYHDLLQGLGSNSPCSDLAISIPKQDLEWAEAEQKRLGIAESGYVLIHGGSSQLAQAKGIDKIYPVQSWAKIVQDFRQKQPDLPMVVVQGPEDKELVLALVGACPGLKPVMPPDIGKLAAMIAGANLMLCTDSAPMHLAVALKVYTVALFGPTDPAKLLPPSDKFLGIKSSTGKMADISPQQVLEPIWGG
uniref:glycosyltransferase family 9 protein n=1 Tax=Oculatella sp. LEGE 06141 TaxID=1828648 RepID=UPI0030DA3390